jgi:hypothetical protein
MHTLKASNQVRNTNSPHNYLLSLILVLTVQDKARTSLFLFMENEGTSGANGREWPDDHFWVHGSMQTDVHGHF